MSFTLPIEKSVLTPWHKYYGKTVPAQLEYPSGSLYDVVVETAQKYPQYIALDFMGKKTNFAELLEQINNCAKSFAAIGIKEGDKVTVCLPNVPAGIIAFYALNAIGAIPSMIHPLTPAKDISDYLNISQSVCAITLDVFYGKFAEIRAKTSIKNLIITKIPDALKPLTAVLFKLTKGRKIKPIPKNAPIIFWNDFINLGKNYKQNPFIQKKAHDAAVILYSGGTSGTTKGILLSNLNLNALAMQMGVASEVIKKGNTILTILPIFHGFGLGCCVHAAVMFALKAVLIPQFSNDIFANAVLKNKPNYIAGVPTIYEALLINKRFAHADLSFLQGVFCGGDSLSAGLKQKVDAFLKAHNCNEQIREGYGLTECVTGSCVCPRSVSKKGAIGIPLPDMYYKIVQVGTTNQVAYNTDGEICIAGPTVMIGYINHTEENKTTLQKHADGLTWLHTGDAGCMDEDGFVYFKQRLKRMIITSGYSVYPSQMESVIDSHEAVLVSCVIGVDDPVKIQKIKAFIVLRPEYAQNPQLDKIKADIELYCKNNLPSYARPFEYEYRNELPRTLVGKVAYTVLEKQEREKKEIDAHV